MLAYLRWKNPIWIFVLGFLLSIPLILPYFHSGYFPTHDGEWAVVRLGDMYRELRDLQFPARYSSNLNFGYGYPLFEFAYPFPYYLGFFIHLLHINFVDTIKLLFASSVPLSFFAMYSLANRLWKSQLAGVLCGILYIYYPYRLVDLYVRGSLGESLSFILFPLILYFLLKVYEQRKMKYALFAGLAIASLVMTHNIMTVEFMVIVIVFCLVCLLHEKKLRRQLLINFDVAIFLGVGLSCFFWLPALAEEHLISLSIIPIAERSLYFVQPLQFLLPSWGYANIGFSYQLGIPQLLIILALMSSFFAFHKKSYDRFIHNIFIAFGIIIAVYIFLLFPPSLLLWKVMPLFKEINYPWTLLASLGFMISLLSGSLVKQPITKWVFIGATIFAIIYTMQYAHPSQFVNRGDTFYLTNDATTTSSDEYMPLWVKQKPYQRVTQNASLVIGRATITQQKHTSKFIQFAVNAEDSSIVQINTIYYPGWRVFVDNHEINIDYTNLDFRNPKGLMRISVSPGLHNITAKFSETPLRWFADCVSIVSLFFAFLLLLPFVQRKLYVKK